MARGFYLSGWTGSRAYTFDRILRGHLHIEAACLTLLGTTQPRRIAEYVQRANAMAAAATDGCNGSACWSGRTVNPDGRTSMKIPEPEARKVAFETFTDASTLTEAEALERGALKGPFASFPSFGLAMGRGAVS